MLAPLFHLITLVKSTCFPSSSSDCSYSPVRRLTSFCSAETSPSASICSATPALEGACSLPKVSPQSVQLLATFYIIWCSNVDHLLDIRTVNMPKATVAIRPLRQDSVEIILPLTAVSVQLTNMSTSQNLGMSGAHFGSVKLSPRLLLK